MGAVPRCTSRLEDVGMPELAATAGPDVTDARAVVVALHGRSSTAESILARTLEITALDPTVAVIAPQAFDNEWYRGRNFEARAALGEALEKSVHDVQALLDSVIRRVPAERAWVCLVSPRARSRSEVFTRRSERLGAVLAFSGAVIGEPNEDSASGRRRRGNARPARRKRKRPLGQARRHRPHRRPPRHGRRRRYPLPRSRRCSRD